MSPNPVVYAAYTGLVNPPNTSQKLSKEQVWAGLEIKSVRAHEFVKAVLSTDVIGTHTDEQGRKVTEREVVFREDGRRVHETVTHFKPMKVDFKHPDGSHVQNIISEGTDGELYLTFDFMWVKEGARQEELTALTEKSQAGAKLGVEGTLSAMREMVIDGRIEV